VNEIRAKNEAARCFLIHAGDEFSVKADQPQTAGTALTFGTQGEANVRVLKALRFDLWTPGNGEFYGGFPNLQARIKQAEFGVLTANVTLRKDGQPLGKAYVIEQAGPVKVAFFGLCWIRPETLRQLPLAMADALETAKKLVPELRTQADLVVAVTHIGLGNDRRLAAAVDGLDLILGGHSHDRLPRGELANTPSGRKILICQAGEYLHDLGRADMKLVCKEGKWQVAEATERLIPLDENVVPDEAITKLIASLGDERGAASVEKKTAPAESPAPEKATVPAQ
jgi:5'-nucleotidase / UDP-sugar diphosphatase